MKDQRTHMFPALAGIICGSCRLCGGPGYFRQKGCAGVVIGYILSRYPLPTETFILREMTAMRALGHEIHVLPLRRARPAVEHPDTHRLRDRVAWPQWPTEWRRAAGTIVRHPGRFRPLARGGWEQRPDLNLMAGAALYAPRTLAITEFCRRKQIQHLHAHFATHATLAALTAHRLCGVPFSFTAHAHDIFQHSAGLEAKLRAACWVVAISEFNRRHLLRHAPVAGKITVIPCGVRVAQYASVPAPAAGPRPLRLLCVAALRPYKGHRALLEACARWRPPRGLELHLAGDGPLRRELERLCRKLGLAERVRFLGWRGEPEVRQQLAWADIIALPSVAEPDGKMDGIPVALMEAMAAGRPVIASRLSGIPELVEDGVNGLLIEPGSVAQLIRALQAMESAELRLRCGRAGQAFVSQHHDLDRNVRRFSDGLEALHTRADEPVRQGTFAA